ncbi:MAG: ATP synthase F1 subunit epsilon [Christensenellales bacterium]|jgi:F-type H+-transporting ATPase subunit epsilon
MEEKKVHLRVVTPQEVKVDQEADMVIVRSLNGDMGVLPGHEPTSAVLGDGILRIIDGKAEQKIAVFGGLAEVQNDAVNILTKFAEWPEDIDRARAENDRKKAEMLLQERADDLKIQSYQVLLRRALVRIEVSIYQEDEEE